METFNVNDSRVFILLIPAAALMPCDQAEEVDDEIAHLMQTLRS